MDLDPIQIDEYGPATFSRVSGDLEQCAKWVFLKVANKKIVLGEMQRKKEIRLPLLMGLEEKGGGGACTRKLKAQKQTKRLQGNFL
jgi:hypothetical protein